MDTVYYHILDLDVIGKEEDFIPFVYDKDNGWVLDQSNVLMDRVMGYDTTETKDSPYKIGNSDMAKRVKEISEVEALKKISEMQ